MSEEEVVYDPLSQAQKHVMLRNGTFEFDSVKQGTCCCGHSINDHLRCVDCCLAKTKEICICEKYLEEGSKVIISQTKQQKLPKMEEQKQKQKQIEDNQLNNYIQTLSKI
jgi:DNA topoisomerase IB